MAKDPRHEIGQLKYYRAIVHNKERIVVKESYPDDEDFRGMIMRKHEVNNAVLFGTDFGVLLNSKQMREVADMMDAWESGELAVTESHGVQHG
jgi:dissimilatory sulfite reductase (desulfoviridin) alpha/beta subunit